MVFSGVVLEFIKNFSTALPERLVQTVIQTTGYYLTTEHTLDQKIILSHHKGFAFITLKLKYSIHPEVRERIKSEVSRCLLQYIFKSSLTDTFWDGPLLS